MSYILDALRKSEDQRRLGQSPDLSAAPVTASSGSASSSKWRIAIVVVLVIALIALAGYWLFIDRPEQGASDVPEAAQSTESSPADTSSDARQAVSEQDSEAEPPVREPAEESAPAQRRRRTIIDRRSPNQQPATAVSRPAPARPGAVRTPPPVVPPGEREQLIADPEQARRLIEAQTQSEPENVRDAEPAASVRSVAPTESSDAEAEDGEWEPERIEFLEKWDLPLSVRQELPELDLSIHVFSGQAADRFVLINGERRLEGAALGDGVRLSEIVRQGAIVEFRDYRFLIRP